jgi:DNA-directed RNA polymerase specialized sigma24 family protein
MEDVTRLISKVSRELGPDASDEEISKKVLEAIEALPESDRAQVLEQVVKGVSSGQLRHLDKEVGVDREADGAKSKPNSESTP